MAVPNQVASDGVAAARVTPTASGAKPTAAATTTTSGAPPGATPPTNPAVGAVPFRIHQPVAGNDLKVLIYGDYGSGKTFLAGTSCDVAEMRDVLYIDAEAGEDTLAGINADIVRIKDFKQFARVREFIQAHLGLVAAGDEDKLRLLEARFKGVEPETITRPKHYRTVVLDSLSEVHKLCMYMILGISIDQYKLDVEPGKPEFKEWNSGYEMTHLLTRQFRNLGLNVIFVCGETYEQDETKKFYYFPALPGKLKKDIQGLLSTVGYLTTTPAVKGGDMKRRLYLERGSNFGAKNRFRNFKGSWLDEPKMSDLWRLQHGAEK